jgi:hypothetical protein
VRRVSNSEVQTFKECRRKWWLAWHRGLRKIDDSPTGALRTGTRIHKALEVLYVPEGVEPGNPMVELVRIAQEDWKAYEATCRESGLDPDADVAKEFHKALDLERTMIDGYLEWLEETGVDSEIIVVAPEQELSVPARDVSPFFPDVELIGKLDVRVQRVSDGKRLFMDHKTAASLTDGIRELRQNEQMLFYHILELHQIATSDDERCVGALYNMLKKVKRTARATPPFYRREFIPHNDDEIESFKIRLLGVIDQMMEVERMLAMGIDHQYAAYPTPTKDCKWKCEFYQLCPMFDDGSRAEDMVKDRFFERNPLDRYQLVRDETQTGT